MTRALHWFRADLRLADNTALAAAAARADELVAVFVLDPALLRSPRSGAPRLRFLRDCLERLARDLDARGVPLRVGRGDPARLLPQLARELGAGLVSFNRDTAPAARRRDEGVRKALEARGIEVLERKDRVVFEAGEVLTRSGGAFAVYGPYRRAWFARLEQDPQPPRRAPRLPPARGLSSDPPPDLSELVGSDATRIPAGGEAAARRRLRAFLAGAVRRYEQDRNRPDLDGTSRLSPYLRFGCLSPRQCLAAAREAAAADPRLARGVEKWLDELVWREFYAAVLERHPRVLRESQRRRYAAIEWNDDPEAFAAWCEGRTGYPIVDAGMRQLLETGWMHNRVRMIAASFLTKDLLVDWRRGERWFHQRLVDADPGSNNGGWQWCASTGTDSAPYFRIFNPVLQGRRCDPSGAYVRRYVPELALVPARWIHCPWQAPKPPAGYPSPCVDHAQRRELALERYAAARAILPGEEADS